MNPLYKNRHIGIWGFGKVGRSAADYFSTQNYTISVMDKRLPNTEESDYLRIKNIAWYHEDDDQGFFFNSVDIIIPSPGINISPMCYATHRKKWLHELDIFYTNFSKPIIAVTGSIGKTSVVHILSVLFERLSIPVAVGGNIGIPMLDLIAQQNDVNYALLEVSSFQLMHCTQFAPAFALWTNFYPNHLDYHATEKEYFLAKRSLLQYQKDNSLALVPFTLRDSLHTHTAHQTCIYFTTIAPTDKELMQLHSDEKIYYIKDSVIMLYANSTHTSIMHLTPTLLNLSFIDNILLITALCDVMQLNMDVLESITQTITLPEHRIEFVGTINNADCYNDSKATTTASTLAAVEKLSHCPLHLFIGGLSKGIDRAPFIAQLKDKVKHMYCFGQEANTLYEMCLNNNISASQYINLDDAITACIAMIASGDCILLSPAGSSYDLYENYEQRGNHFKRLIMNRMSENKLL